LDKEDEQTRTVTDADLAVVRLFPVIWVPIEAGAPAICEFDELGQRALGNDRVEEYRRAMRAAEVLVQLGELSPGRYEYENPLGEMPSEFQPFIENRYADVRGQRVSIEVTEAHLKLLHASNMQVVDEGGFHIRVEMHCKRPYGDMTYFEIDMGAILGIEPEGPPRADRPQQRDFSEPQLQKFAELHEQTQPVLQVLLQQATLLPGRYVRESRWAPWQQADLLH